MNIIHEARQEHEKWCTAYAEKNGITIVKHYIDRAISAKTDNRPEFQQMIKDLSLIHISRKIFAAFFSASYCFPSR